MRITAYVLAGDPAWIEQSIASYYDIVERIVVAYDQDGRSWSGAPLSVEESLARLRGADPRGKFVFLPGGFSDPTRPPMDLETEQRQVALDAASEDSDWVLQLDTDEIVLSPRRLVAEIEAADAKGARALEFPLRVFYARTPRGRFLEQSGRLWTVQASYPGPVAVASGTSLTFARQVSGAPSHRVDVAAWNTDPAHSADTRVHSVVAPSEAVVHMSWVRSEAQLAEKAIVSGHAGDPHWNDTVTAWRRRSQHPLRAVLVSPFVRDPFSRYRLSTLPRFARMDP